MCVIPQKVWKLANHMELCNLQDMKLAKKKLIQGFQHLEWSFLLLEASEAGLNLTVRKATVVLGDETKTIKSGQLLGPHEEVTFTSRQTISLPVGGSAMYSGALPFWEWEEQPDKEECAAAAASYIKV
jgi:hypothetical protein